MPRFWGSWQNETFIRCACTSPTSLTLTPDLHWSVWCASPFCCVGSLFHNVSRKLSGPMPAPFSLSPCKMDILCHRKMNVFVLPKINFYCPSQKWKLVLTCVIGRACHLNTILKSFILKVQRRFFFWNTNLFSDILMRHWCVNGLERELLCNACAAVQRGGCQTQTQWKQRKHSDWLMNFLCVYVCMCVNAMQHRRTTDGPVEISL